MVWFVVVIVALSVLAQIEDIVFLLNDNFPRIKGAKVAILDVVARTILIVWGITLLILG